MLRSGAPQFHERPGAIEGFCFPTNTNKPDGLVFCFGRPALSAAVSLSCPRRHPGPNHVIWRVAPGSRFILSGHGR